MIPVLISKHSNIFHREVTFYITLVNHHTLNLSVLLKHLHSCTLSLPGSTTHKQARAQTS